MVNLSNVSKKFIIPNKEYNTLFKTFIQVIKGLNRYTTIRALDSVTIDIKRGETVGIIGPNGSGKSTLLRIIGGIYKPTSGAVRVKGEMISVLQLGIGFLSDLTLKENVFLFGAIMGLDRKYIRRNFSKIIDFAGLSEFVNAEVRTLSLGMKERFAFSIMAQSCKDILLLDETLAIGDQRFKEKCFDVMKKLKNEGKTVIFSSHDLRMVRQVSDKVVLLNSGRVVDFGLPDNVINRYKLNGK